MWAFATAQTALKRVSPLAWLIVAALIVTPFYLAFFYRILSAFGVVGCAMPLS